MFSQSIIFTVQQKRSFLHRKSCISRFGNVAFKKTHNRSSRCTTIIVKSYLWTVHVNAHHTRLYCLSTSSILLSRNFFLAFTAEIWKRYLLLEIWALWITQYSLDYAEIQVNFFFFFFYLKWNKIIHSFYKTE